MLSWNTIHFLGLGFQIAAGITGALTLSWIRISNGHVEINHARLRAVKIVGWVALGFFTIGAILILWYEIYML
jgi:hypothetical protein